MTSPTSFTRQTDHRDHSTCRHHWLIQPAAGPISLGVCQMCGETREFKNYVESGFWMDFNVGLRSGVDSHRIADQDDDNNEGPEGDDDDGV